MSRLPEPAPAALSLQFLAEIASGMPVQRQEQTDIPIRVMPNGDTAGARGAALEALRVARQSAAAR